MRNEQKAISFQDYKDIISATIILCISVLMFIEATHIEGHIQSGIVNAQFMPRIISILMAFTSSIVLIQGVFTLRRKIKSIKGVQDSQGQETNDVTQRKDDLVPLTLTAVILVLYAMTFRPLGFILSSMIYLFCQISILTLKKKKTRRWLVTTIATSIVIPITIYIIFRYGLEILLPVGILG